MCLRSGIVVKQPTWTLEEDANNNVMCTRMITVRRPLGVNTTAVVGSA